MNEVSTAPKEHYDALERFVIERYFYNRKTDIRNEPLFSTGIIDSLSVLELILKIEDTFELEFPIQYLIDDRVDTFAQIEKTIDRVYSRKRAC